jgi:putative ABC transport system permease protein
MIYTDENYFDLLKINLIAGRDFDDQRDKTTEDDETVNVIVNQASLKEYNIDLNDAVGTTLLSEYDDKIRKHQIIGVVEDFHQFSLHDKIVPIMFKLPASKKNFIFITMSVSTADYKNVISQLESNWKAQVPTTPFESTFLSESVNKQYEEDQRVASIMTSFTLIAIIISCMGLYGLSVYMAERRIKEIGIRKVLGASVSGIVSLLTTDFLKLILIAFVIAAPLGYYAMGEWLQSFAYQTTLGVSVFVLAGVVSFAIAWITVGFESFRAAVGNPVNSLKTE